MGAGGQEEQVVHAKAGAMYGVGVEEVDFVIVQQEVAEVEV